MQYCGNNCNDSIAIIAVYYFSISPNPTTKWQAKATSSLKTAKSLPLMPYSPLHVTQSSSIHGQSHNQLCAC